LTQREGTLKLVYLILQQTSGEVNTAFDGSQGLIEHDRDLMVFVSFKVKHEGLFENAGQLMNGFLDILHAYGSFSGIGDGRLIVVQQKFIGTIIENGILLGFAAIVVDEDIAHDGVEPGFDVGAYTVFFLVGERSVHGLLDQVFCRLMVFRKCNRKWPEILRISKQQLIEFLSRHDFLFK
jgi:hypothetical protein